MKGDQVLQAATIARMQKRAAGVQFQLLVKNGFFATIGGSVVLEFDTQPEAQAVISSLNAAIAPVLTAFVNDYEAKIEDLIA